MKRLALLAALALATSPALANEGNDGIPAVAPASAPETYPTGHLVRIIAPYAVDADGFRHYDFAQARRMPDEPKRGLFALGAAQIADCGTTALGLALGVAAEANPIAILLGGRSLPLCLLRQAALHAYARSHPDFARNATASEAGAALSNAAVILR